MSATETIKLIDKKFQLRTTFTIIGIMLTAFIIIIAFAGITATRNNKEISRTVMNLNMTIRVEDNIVNAFIDYSKHIRSSDLTLHSKMINDDHKKNMDVIKKHITILNGLIKRNFHLISIILIVVILLIIGLYLYLMNITHRISGPIYVMSMQIKNIIEGKDPHFRELRDKDEFKDFYDKFIVMIDKLKEDKG